MSAQRPSDDCAWPGACACSHRPCRFDVDAREGDGAPRPSEADVESMAKVLAEHMSVGTSGRWIVDCGHSPQDLARVLASDWIAARDAEHERSGTSDLVLAHMYRVAGDEYLRRAEAAERALADLRGQIETLDRSGRMSFDHSDLRALLPRDDAAGAGGAG